MKNPNANDYAGKSLDASVNPSDGIIWGDTVSACVECSRISWREKGFREGTARAQQPFRYFFVALFVNKNLDRRASIFCALIGRAMEKAPRAPRLAQVLPMPAPKRESNELVRKMTLDEKVGQLVQYSAGQPTGPGPGRTDYDDTVPRQYAETCSASTWACRCRWPRTGARNSSGTRS